MNFGDLYSYSTKNGIVIPQTSDVKASVQSAFKSIFGSDFSVEDETPQGRLIEAITLLFVDVLRVNAINANGFNPEQAVGTNLDHLAKLFSLVRSGLSDAQLRERIINGQSRTNGYPQSIMNAVSNVPHVGSVCVLENGHPYPVVLPNSENGISVSPHSVFVAVGGDGTDTDFDDDVVAKAIYESKSAGCGYEDSAEYGTVTERTITDSATGSENVVKFYHATEKTIGVSVTVNGQNYTGVDIVADVSNLVTSVLAGKSGGSSVSVIDMTNALALSGLGVVALDASFTVSGSTVQSVTIKPFEVVSAGTVNVTVV